MAAAFITADHELKACVDWNRISSCMSSSSG
jgi:hypothetical protein